LIDEVPASGSSPRQFALNIAGDKVAVGVQNNGWAIIFNRDTKTSEMVNQLAVVGGLRAGGVVCTTWNECNDASED
jgi:6-phosphogluconolactonase (cycloisomerase 2 family)